MPVYLCKIRGSEDKHLVRARSQSKAAKHLVDAESLSAESLADHIGKGLTLETATVAEDRPAEPAVEPGKETPEGKGKDK